MRSILLSLLCLFSALTPPFSAAEVRRPLTSKVTDGEYPDLVRFLGQVSYEPQTLYRLKRPKLLWFDEAWFRQQGYSIDAAFEQNILDELAWAIPDPQEPRSAYTREARIYYADRYGGKGINGHRGSGRAASKGKIQIKGVGRTSLVNTYAGKSDTEHSTGRVSLTEGLGETIASQIADQELPYGANRVVAVILTGTQFWDSSSRLWIPRVLIVREDPLRPGHFITNANSNRTKREADRMKFVMSTIDQALPQAANSNPSTRSERIQLGVTELVRRHAQVAAYSYANRLLHSAFSPSNEEISGAALDYGSFMALDGYSRAGRLQEGEYNGETKAVENVIKEIIKSLKTNLPAKERGLVLTEKQALKLFEETYHRSLAFDFVALVGLPKEFLARLRSSAAFQTLSETLINIAQDGNDQPIDALNSVIGRTGSYDLPRILQKMATTLAMSTADFNDDTLIAELEAPLKSEILEVKVRHDLVTNFVQLLRETNTLASRGQISQAALRKYIFLAADLRNRRLAHLINDAVSGDYWAVAAETFVKKGNLMNLRQKINDAIETGRRTFKDAAPYMLVLSEKRMEDGRLEREVFDLKANRMKKVILSADECERHLGN